jgi:predicted RecA/RadA family phage recombinase
MASNHIQPGKVLSLLAPYEVASGAGFQVGSLFAVALGAAANGAAVEGQACGVWELAKTSAQAWTVGQKIYWDNGNKRCDSDGTVGMLIGVATEIEDNPTATGKVRLNGVAPASSEGPQGAIVALTDSTGGSGTHDDTLADGLTATAPDATTGYTAHSSGSTPVTSAAATDLDTTAAALATLVTEVTALRAVVAACVTDLTTQNQNDSDLAQKILEIRTALISSGVIAA